MATAQLSKTEVVSVRSDAIDGFEKLQVLIPRFALASCADFPNPLIFTPLSQKLAMVVQTAVPRAPNGGLTVRS